MPNAFTRDIYEGKSVTFRQFALTCVRAFSVLDHMAAEPIDAPIRLIENPSVLEQNVLKALRERTRLVNLSVPDAQVLADNEYDQAQQIYTDLITKSEAVKERLLTMLDQVRTWVPPTENHDAHKHFMIRTLTNAIDYETNCRPSAPIRQDGKSWKLKELKWVLTQITSDTLAAEEEKSRLDRNNQWITDLLEALPEALLLPAAGVVQIEN